jgi:DASH complex subunit DAD2
VGSSAAYSPALVARIEEKKAELAHLQELKELSAAVATQMEALEQKLSTLSDGTEGRRVRASQVVWDNAINNLLAVATVLGNWHNVLRAINMASSMRSSLHAHVVRN